MSKIKIEKALKAKGITATHIEYQRGCPVPEGYASGWYLEFDEETEDAMWDLDNCCSFFTYNEFDSLKQVMCWIEKLPTISLGVSK